MRAVFATAIVIASTSVACGRLGFDPATADGTPGSVDGTNDVPGPPARVTSGLVALYLFDEGSGVIAADVSGVAPALDLRIGTMTAWVSGGLEFQADAGAATSMSAATKISDACIASGEMTVEAWIQSASVNAAGPERIFAVGGGGGISDASLGEEGDSYYGQIRLTSASTKLRSTTGSTSTNVQHLVHTRSVSGARVLYLDGAVAGTTTTFGSLANWDLTLPVTAGNAPDGGVGWPGRIFLAAIYCRALSAAEVAANFAAGPD